MVLFILGAIGFLWGLSMSLIYGGPSSEQHDIAMKHLSNLLMVGSVSSIIIAIALFKTKKS
jgi:hypothetical protein